MFYDESGNYVDSYLPTASTGTFVVYDTNTTAGSFMFAKRSSNNDYSNNYYYLTGGVRYSISREYYYANQTAYTFSDSSSTYYLYYDFVNNKIVSSNSEQGKWFVNNNAYYVQKNTIPSNSPSTNYYIGRDNYGRVSLTTTSTTWSINNNHLYNGSQYLVHINGLNGGFGLSDNAYIYKINYNGNYLNYSTPTAITTGTSQTDATEWIVTGNYIHTVINDTTYFLTVSNNQLTLSTNPSTTFAISNNKITYNNLSLVYENGSWKFRNDYYLITDGTYYLNEDLSSTTVASNATRWYNQSGKLFTDNNIYLYNNNGTLSTTTSENAANSWTISSNTIYNGDYYLTYIDGFRLVGPRYYIRSGNNYLTYDGSIGNQASQTDASKWAISNGSSIGGYIFTLYNGNEYYLYNNSGTLSVTNDKNTATNWSISNGTPTNNGYALQYDNGWTLKADYKTISGTYNNRTYYMYLNGNSITANQSNSTQFIFIESADGTIIKNATASQYLYNNNGTLALTNSESNATKWSKDNNIFYDGKYFIDCNGTNWVLTRFMYYLYDSQVDNDGTTYPYYFTGTGSNNGTRAGSTTSQSSATTYYLNDNNTISPTSNTNYYLYRSGNDVYIGSNANNRFTFDSSTNYLKTGNYYVYYSPSNSRFRNGTNYQDTFEFIKANGFTITINQISINSLTYNTVSNPTCNANVTDIPGNSYSRSQIYALRANSTGKLLSYRTSNFQYSDTYYVDYSTDLIDYNTAYATYFPINADPENGYQAVNSNTGYIIAGGNLQNNESGYQGSGDIRISRYSISGNISASLSGSTLNDSAVYTINGDGLKTITTAGGSEIFQKYSSSKSDFEETLALDTSYVYGLHFMDSTITVKELVTAKHVLINGETIDNYQMPADSIDFTLKEKGYINFFAGTYFPNNDSFFSLHKIVRDDNPQSATYRQITNIKEILQVWGESNQDEAQYAKYIYKVLDSKTGQTYYEYTNGYKEGIYVGTQESDLPDSYELKFDTNWIKISGNVQGITKSGNNTSGTGYIYYFEVPADSGEYALGSVPGGKGAYLLYLDIAANAGDVEKDVMDYIKGVDFVKTNETSILDTIRNNAPTATFAIKDSFAYSDNQKVTISRSDSTEGNITTITFTITGSTANQSENMRYYYVDDDTGQKRYVFVFEPSS